MEFTCPMCKAMVGVIPGDWELVRSQIIVHFSACEVTRTLKLASTPLRLIASRVADDLLPAAAAAPGQRTEA